MLPRAVTPGPELKKDDKGRLLRDQMFCALCPKTFKYNQSPSALTDHLRHRHADKMLELESAKQSQSKLTDFRFTKADVQEKYKASHPKQKQFRSDVVDWVVKDKRPFAISDDQGLRKVVKNLGQYNSINFSFYKSSFLM